MMNGGSEEPEKRGLRNYGKSVSEEGLIELDCRETWR